MLTPVSTSKEWSFTEAFEGKDERTITVTDPVCGMPAEIDQAAAREERAGWAYFFCSAQCCQLFREKPGHYVGAEWLCRPDPRLKL